MDLHFHPTNARRHTAGSASRFILVRARNAHRRRFLTLLARALNRYGGEEETPLFATTDRIVIHLRRERHTHARTHERMTQAIREVIDFLEEKTKTHAKNEQTESFVRSLLFRANGIVETVQYLFSFTSDVVGQVSRYVRFVIGKMYDGVDRTRTIGGNHGR